MDSREGTSAPESGSDETVDRQVSRRTLVKAGATVAWTVPLVQFVAAAPANAAVTSGTKTTLQWLGLSAAYPGGDGSTLTVNLSVKNSGGNDAVPLMVDLQLPSSLSGATVSAPRGWSLSSGSGSYTFTKTSLGKGATASLALTFSLPNASGDAFTLLATARAANAVSVPDAVSVAAAPDSKLTATLSAVSYPGGDASELKATVSVKNTGNKDASALQVDLQLPTALATATVAAPTGWSVTNASGTFTFTKDGNGALAKGATDGFTVTFSLPNADGDAFKLDAIARATHAGAASDSFNVVAAAKSKLAITGANGSGNPTANFLGQSLTQFSVSAGVKNTGLRTVEDVVLTMRFTKSASIVTPPDAAWAVSTATGSGKTFVFTHSGSTTPGATAGLNVVFQVSDPTPNLTINASATNGTDAPKWTN